MLQEEVQACESLTSDKELWDERGDRLVIWSLGLTIVGLVLASFLIVFFLV